MDHIPSQEQLRELLLRLDHGEYEHMRFLHYPLDESHTRLITIEQMLMSPGTHHAEALREINGKTYHAELDYTVTSR